MEQEPRSPKLLGMTTFEIIVLVVLVFIASAIVIFLLNFNRNMKTAAPIIPTAQPTYTAYPTFTPLPQSTQAVVPNIEATSTSQPAATLGSNQPIGVIKVNSWSLDILEVHSDPGKDSSRQVVVVLANLTNEGTGTDTFVVNFNINLMDSQGRKYEVDDVAGFAAQDKYQTEYSASIDPGASIYYSFAFDVPATENSFSLIAGDLASSWSGDVSFRLP
jgi:hypothetical protein